ncbi:MAG: hypothetical protein E6Q89_01325 [Bacteroidia bacterium]|nr:MAG: hypothetical protein E6Q89_01325 [Bacteroidia bacterium]
MNLIKSTLVNHSNHSSSKILQKNPTIATSVNHSSLSVSKKSNSFINNCLFDACGVDSSQHSNMRQGIADHLEYACDSLISQMMGNLYVDVHTANILLMHHLDMNYDLGCTKSIPSPSHNDGYKEDLINTVKKEILEKTADKITNEDSKIDLLVGVTAYSKANNQNITVGYDLGGKTYEYKSVVNETSDYKNIKLDIKGEHFLKSSSLSNTQRTNSVVTNTNTEKSIKLINNKTIHPSTNIVKQVIVEQYIAHCILMTYLMHRMITNFMLLSLLDRFNEQPFRSVLVLHNNVNFYNRDRYLQTVGGIEEQRSDFDNSYAGYTQREARKVIDQRSQDSKTQSLAEKIDNKSNQGTISEINSLINHNIANTKTITDKENKVKMDFSQEIKDPITMDDFDKNSNSEWVAVKTGNGKPAVYNLMQRSSLAEHLQKGGGRNPWLQGESAKIVEQDCLYGEELLKWLRTNTQDVVR